MKQNKLKRLLLTVGIFFSLLLIISISYAWFTINITGNENAKVIDVGASKLSLIFTDGDEINADNLEPGWETTKTLSVENDGTVGVFYSIVWDKFENTITNGELLIKGTCINKDGSECSNITEIPVEDTVAGLKESIYIEPGEIQTYKITFSFVEKNVNQNYNQGKSFSGRITIVENTKKYILAGTVSDKSDNAISNATVSIGTNSTTSTDDGTFTLEEVSTGINKISVVDNTNNIDYGTKDIKIVTGEFTNTSSNDIVANDSLDYVVVDIVVDNNKIADVSTVPATLFEHMIDSEEAKSDQNINFAADKDGCYYDISTNKTVCPDGCTIDNYIVTCEEGKGDTNGKGLYYTSDTSLTENNKKVYYYRGTVTNNNVIFSGYCWNILRTNENGSIKLVFSGRATNTGNGYSCPDLSGKEAINFDLYNYGYGDLPDVTFLGYMSNYAFDDDTAINTVNIKEANSNKESSYIKLDLDYWYENYLANKADIVDAPYCNDRSLATDKISNLTYVNDKYSGYGLHETAFAGLQRLYNLEKPIYKCPQLNDKFSISSFNGNGKLTYPIALLTSDELVYAGNTPDTESENFLYMNETYWTMTPSDLWSKEGAMLALTYGAIDIFSTSKSYGDASYLGYVPVISIRPNIEVLNGNGTYSNPYVLDNVTPRTDGVFVPKN